VQVHEIETFFKDFMVNRRDPLSERNFYVVPKKFVPMHMRKWISETWKRNPSLLYLHVHAKL
jgi:hypothetical protein